MEEFPNKAPFNTFPYKEALQIIDKMVYLGEEASPYEISPGTNLCISDTYYTLGFFNFLHAYGRVVKGNGDLWKLNPSGEPISQKPYRFSLIEDAVRILESLLDGPKTIDEITAKIPNIEKIFDIRETMMII